MVAASGGEGGPVGRGVAPANRQADGTAIDEPPAATTQPAAAFAPPPHRPVVEPLASDRDLVKFTARAAMLGKLRRAQDLLRHAVPNGDAAEIFDRALTALVRGIWRSRSSRARIGRTRADQ